MAKRSTEVCVCLFNDGLLTVMRSLVKSMIISISTSTAIYSSMYLYIYMGTSISMTYSDTVTQRDFCPGEKVRIMNTPCYCENFVLKRNSVQ